MTKPLRKENCFAKTRGLMDESAGFRFSVEEKAAGMDKSFGGNEKDSGAAGRTVVQCADAGPPAGASGASFDMGEGGQGAGQTEEEKHEAVHHGGTPYEWTDF